MKCYGCHKAIGEVGDRVTLYRSQSNGVISTWHPPCWLAVDQTTAGGPAMGTYRTDGIRLVPEEAEK